MCFIPVEKSALKTLRSEIKKLLKDIESLTEKEWKKYIEAELSSYPVLYRFLKDEEIQKAAAGSTLHSSAAHTAPKGVLSLGCLKDLESDDSKISSKTGEEIADLKPEDYVHIQDHPWWLSPSHVKGKRRERNNLLRTLVRNAPEGSL